MIEFLQGYWLMVLPSVLLQDTALTFSLTLLGILVIVLVGSFLIESNYKIIGGSCITFALMMLGALFVTPKTEAIADFASNYPEHPDSKLFIEFINTKNVDAIKDLNEKWVDYKSLEDLISLWQVTNMLPEKHPIREEYIKLSQGGVMSKYDYQNLLRTIITQEIDNPEEIASLLGKVNGPL